MLTVENLWYRYPNSDWILRGVNLYLDNEDMLLVLGRSGSGKSTLAIALTGIGVHIYGGEVKGDIYINGKSIESISNSINRYIALVSQNPYNHFIEHRVRDDLYGYAESIYDEKEASAIVENIVKLMDIENILDRKFFELSGGEARRAAIAKALISNPSVIILDEPLMWLDDTGVDSLRKSINMLKLLGKSIIVLEHRFLPLLDLANKIFILRDGVLEEISKDMLKPREIPLEYNHRRYNGFSKKEEILKISNLWFRYDGEWILRDVNMVAHRGELIALYGLNGSGKSTLLKIISGYLKPSKGSIKIFGRAIYLPQNINLFFTEATVREEINAICKYNRIGDKCLGKAIELLRDLQLYIDLDISPFNLSWGQKIRLAIALSMLIDNVNILLFDEPFTGLTYYERYCIAKIINSLPKTKIVSLSSRDSIHILDIDALYILSNGHLEKASISDDHISKSQTLSLVNISKKLYGYGE
ncbi:ABC transporter related [Ignisphaera aggregans DSM 17230]|uniref:ABC transporter related n=1 Tax=Ignisphaera aggregans (strain DSM 17230 / JCM 13409 / AQ1.S1) TaxID=583356 RepID=E0SNJ8_IGNAA|nr:ABC transporter related [Ignisphaera aggregans DSM 17230]